MIIANYGGMQIRYPDELYWRLDGINDGVPFYNLTSVSATEWIYSSDQQSDLNTFELTSDMTSFFVGSLHGVSFYDSRAEEWYSFQEGRWLVGKQVVELFRVDGVEHFIVTDDGLNFIYREEMNLAKKSKLIEGVYDSGRHGRRDLGEGTALLLLSSL